MSEFVKHIKIVADTFKELVTINLYITLNERLLHKSNATSDAYASGVKYLNDLIIERDHIIQSFKTYKRFRKYLKVVKP